MQLMRSVFLLAVAVASLHTSLHAAVLPEDRADVLYHRYNGGGMEIQGPSVLVRKGVAGRVSLSANYYVDKVSSASVDVVTTASPYREERKEKSVGMDYLAGKAIYSLGYTTSVENDYDAKAFNFGASQDFFGDLTTLSFGYARGDDTVRRTGDALFEEAAMRQHFRFGITQVITKNMLMSLSHEFISDEGFLNNPYRSVRYVDSAQAKGYGYQSEIYPNTRTSEATALRAGYYLPWQSAVHAEYRRFADSWGIDASDWGLDYIHPLKNGVELEVNYRQYSQTAADFYADLFPFQNAQNFLARDKEMSKFNSNSYGVAVNWDFFKERTKYIDRLGFRIAIDRYSFRYDNFRDLRVSVPVPGTEPLYAFKATVTQLLFTAWY